MTNVKPATDEQVARFKVRAVIGALWSDEALSLIARIDADREEPRALRQAIGMLTTLHPTMVMDPLNPVGMALQVHAHVTQEIAALKADQADWRKGVGFIAAALGIDSLSCVDIAERGLEIRAERDALKAEVERLKASVRLACSDDTERAARLERLTPAFLPCHVCGGKGISDIIHGAVVRCENCDGTGRAR